MFSMHPRHIEAKRQYKKWYKGFHVVISEIQQSYGDGFFPHITPNSRSNDGAGQAPTQAPTQAPAR